LENKIYSNAEFCELRRLLADTFDVDEEMLTPTTSFEDLGGSSLLALEVAVTLEKKYGIKIPEIEMKQMTNLEKAYNLIKKKQNVENSDAEFL
jgi:acyl carrier protein